jgi:hypothetical protein
MVTGGGLEAEIHPDRAMDLGQVTFDGIPGAWMSPAGLTHPAPYEPRGTEWLGTFGGGLVATCGLDTFGPPSIDGDVELGLHGRVGAGGVLTPLEKLRRRRPAKSTRLLDTPPACFDVARCNHSGRACSDKTRTHPARGSCMSSTAPGIVSESSSAHRVRHDKQG